MMNRVRRMFAGASRGAVLVLAAAFTLSAGASAAAADAPAPAREPSFLPETPDEGTFRFYLNEEVLVTTEFRWDEEGYRSSYVLSTAGQSVTTRLSIIPGGSGLWARMVMEAPGRSIRVTREDDMARIAAGEDTATVTLPPGTLPFENFSPALMTLAVRAYDEERGGKQDLPLFLVPRAVLGGNLERLGVERRTVAGRDIELTRYRFGLPGVDVFLYVDAGGRVLLGEVPAQHGAYVREGYEGLRRKGEADSLLSQPVFETSVEHDVRVPMRDGVKLAMDLYRPRGEGPFPIILVRTPYKKEMQELQGLFYARRGYVYAVQDCRGRFSSGGRWEPFMNEAHDGYDTVEWLASRPWSSGRVGMIGASYLGWTQWWAAGDRPPHLVTIIPNVAPPDPLHNVPYEYGTFFLLGAIWWADVLESEATADISGQALRQLGEKEYATLLRHLPVVDLDKEVLGKKNRYWREWIAHPERDDYWEPACFVDRLEHLDIPVFHQSGWFDGDGIGSKLNYLAMISHGHANQKLVLGPWGHTDTATRRIGERDFGEAATPDLQRDYLRWFDRWLKDVPNGIEEEPLVSLFIMGENRWLHGDVYPLPETEMTSWYLASGGKANTSGGDGRLSPEPPGSDGPPDRYRYDPGDPTPSPTFYVADDSLGKGTVSVEEEHARRTAYHARVDSTRSDILVYDTEPLAAPLRIAGPVSAVLFASSSARDTDWFVSLSEVDAEGGIFPLVTGKVRARYRNTLERAEFLEPDEVYQYDLDLWQTGIRIPAGHRLRVEVASARFPVFSRNLNTGEHNETGTSFVAADQSVYHDAARPSRIVLPVIPDEE